MDDEKVPEGAGGFDGLPPEVMRGVGVALVAVMFWACLAGLVFGALIAVLAVL